MRHNSFRRIFLIAVPHPPYSPGLALSDFWIFGHITTSIADYVFNDIGELLEAIVELNEIQPSELPLVLYHGVERVK
jgi:hypothetical protein